MPIMSLYDVCLLQKKRLASDCVVPGCGTNTATAWVSEDPSATAGAAASGLRTTTDVGAVASGRSSPEECAEPYH